VKTVGPACGVRSSRASTCTGPFPSGSGRHSASPHDLEKDPAQPAVRAAQNLVDVNNSPPAPDGATPALKDLGGRPSVVNQAHRKSTASPGKHPARPDKEDVVVVSDRFSFSSFSRHLRERQIASQHPASSGHPAEKAGRSILMSSEGLAAEADAATGSSTEVFTWPGGNQN